MKTLLVHLFLLYGVSAHFGASLAISGIEKRPEFMGKSVNMLQYSRLKDLQQHAIKADRYMKHLAWTHAPGVLMKNPQWKELVSIWHSLQALLPKEIKK